VSTYAPAGDCGGPAGWGNCYGFEINANANLPGRSAVIDQPSGAGHAVFLGFDAWFRAWTTQEERLVLNAALYPSAPAIPATEATRRAVLPPSRPEHPQPGIVRTTLPSCAPDSRRSCAARVSLSG
jgi:hypothetical protein